MSMERVAFLTSSYTLSHGFSDAATEGMSAAQGQGSRVETFITLISHFSLAIQLDNIFYLALKLDVAFDEFWPTKCG